MKVQDTTLNGLPTSLVHAVAFFLDLQSIGRLRLTSSTVFRCFSPSSDFWYLWILENGCSPLIPPRLSFQCPCRTRVTLLTWHDQPKDNQSETKQIYKPHHYPKIAAQLQERDVAPESCSFHQKERVLRCCAAGIDSPNEWYQILRYRMVTANGSWFRKRCMEQKIVGSSVPPSSRPSSPSLSSNNNVDGCKDEKTTSPSHHSTPALEFHNTGPTVPFHWTPRLDLLSPIPEVVNMCQSVDELGSNWWNLTMESPKTEFDEFGVQSTLSGIKKFLGPERCIKVKELIEKISELMDAERNKEVNHIASSSLSAHVKSTSVKDSLTYNPKGDPNVISRLTCNPSIWIATRPVGPKVIWDRVSVILRSIGIQIALGAYPISHTKPNAPYYAESLVEETPVYLSFPVYSTRADRLQVPPPCARFSSNSNESQRSRSFDSPPTSSFADWTNPTEPYNDAYNNDYFSSSSSASSSHHPVIDDVEPKLQNSNFLEKDKTWKIADRWSSTTECMDFVFFPSTPFVLPRFGQWSAGCIAIQSHSVSSVSAKLPFTSVKQSLGCILQRYFEHHLKALSVLPVSPTDSLSCQFVLRGGLLSGYSGKCIVIINPSLTLLVFLGSLVGPLGRVICIIDPRVIEILQSNKTNLEHENDQSTSRSSEPVKIKKSDLSLSLLTTLDRSSTNDSSSSIDPSLFNYCTASLYEWVSLWLGNVVLIWTNNCTIKGYINQGIEQSGMQFYTPFVDFNYSLNYSQNYDKNGVKYQSCISQRSENQFDPVNNDPEKQPRASPIVCIPVPLSSKLSNTEIKSKTSYSSVSISGKCCLHCRPNPVEFFCPSNHAQHIKCHERFYAMSLARCKSDTNSECFQIDNDDQRRVESPVLIVVDLPARLSSHHIDAESNIFVRSRTHAFLLNSLNATINALDIHKPEVDIVAVVGWDGAEDIVHSPAVMNPFIWRFLKFRPFEKVGTLEDIHILRSRFIRVMNAFFQRSPLLPSLCLNSIIAAIERITESNYFLSNNEMSPQAKMKGYSTFETEETKIEKDQEESQSLIHPRTGQAYFSDQLDQGYRLNSMSCVSYTPTVAESIRNVVVLSSFFIRCLGALFDAMDVEWRDMISFDEDLEAIPLGDGNFQQFVAFATFHAHDLTIDD